MKQEINSIRRNTQMTYSMEIYKTHFSTIPNKEQA
jgi:hypothetical protein